MRNDDTAIMRLGLFDSIVDGLLGPRAAVVTDKNLIGHVSIHFLSCLLLRQTKPSEYRSGKILVLPRFEKFFRISYQKISIRKKFSDEQA